MDDVNVIGGGLCWTVGDTRYRLRHAALSWKDNYLNPFSRHGAVGVGLAGIVMVTGERDANQ